MNKAYQIFAYKKVAYYNRNEIRNNNRRMKQSPCEISEEKLVKNLAKMEGVKNSSAWRRERPRSTMSKEQITKQANKGKKIQGLQQTHILKF